MARRMRAASVLALLLLLPASAHAAFPGRNGPIVISGEGLPAGCQYDCVPGFTFQSVNPDGSGLLTHPFKSSFNMEPSPDGRQITFSTGIGIWIYDASAKHGRKILANGLMPSWSPDGRRIVFVEGSVINGNAGNPMDVMTDQGKHARRVGANGFMPKWSPDGRGIAYMTGTPVGQYKNEIDIINARTGKRNLLFRAPYRYTVVNGFDWAPDGKSLVVEIGLNSPFDCCEEPPAGTKPEDPREDDVLGIGLVSRAGKFIRLLRKPFGTGPVFSPDGRRIAFSATDDNGAAVFTVDLHGHGLKRVMGFANDVGSMWGPGWLARPH
jgi:WD40-like Beta Propeller Repeat